MFSWNGFFDKLGGTITLSLVIPSEIKFFCWLETTL